MRTLSIIGPRALGTLAFALAISAPQLVHAAALGDCDTVFTDETAPKRIFGTGGSAATPTIKSIAIALANLPEPITILYADPSACDGFKDFTTNSTAANRSFKVWSADGTENTCTATAHAVDFAHMGNSDAWCADKLPTEGALRSGDFLAPVQTVNFITDKDSSEDVISAEALYHIFGFGPGAEYPVGTDRSVSPWTNPDTVFARKVTSFIQLFGSELIFGDRAKAASFKVKDTSANFFLDTNQKVVDAVYNAGAVSQDAANASLGFVSGSTANDGTNPDKIKVLAYQHYDQTCAYLPDSSRTKFDRANVRSGQYFLWTQGHFYARTGDDGKASNPIVRDLIQWVQGTAAAPNDIDVQGLIIAAGDVPLCAMHAIRSTGDLSPIQSYQPEAPCHGYYEYKATGDTDYQSCTDDSTCTDADFPKCRGFGDFKFCEAQ